jgi:hypothetical protein
MAMVASGEVVSWMAAQSAAIGPDRVNTRGAGRLARAVARDLSMHHYQLFGGVIASELEFPELPAAGDGRADWTLRCRNGPHPVESLPHVGSESVMQGVRVALQGSPSRFLLQYDDTGTFELADGGRAITWYRPCFTTPDPGNVRTDVLGRVMAVALHTAGVPTLHGSGVSVGGTAVAFLAPKLHGKSTTAAALVRAGAELLGDDILAITPGDRPMVLPAVPAVNLWHDSARRLDHEAAPADATRKTRVDWDALGTRARAPVPLGALYLLRPVPDGATAQVTRERLSPVPAALALMGQAKIGELLGVAGAKSLMEQLARVTAAVPVYRLSVPRELGRLDELVARMGEWHDTPLRLPDTADVS